MPLLIDTYNVLHTVGVLPPDLAGIDVQGLIGLLQTSRYRHQRVILVCDGSPPADARTFPRPESIAIRYSGSGRSADDLIGQLVSVSSAPRQLVVVSSDHAVQRSARRRRCTTLSAPEFLQHLADDARGGSAPKAPAAKPPGSAMTDEQVQRWINVFSLDQETVRLQSQEPVQVQAPSPAASPSAASLSSTTPPGPERAMDKLSPVLPPDLIAQAEHLLIQDADLSSNPPKSG